MHNTLFPAHVEINYISAFGPHTQTIPSVPLAQGVDGIWEFDLRGAAVSVDIDDAVTDWINVLVPLTSADTTFTDWIAYTWDEPDGIATPVAGGALGIVGYRSNFTGYNRKATQATFSFRTDEYGRAKIILLDLPLLNFDKVTNAADATWAALINYVTADVTWMAGRDGGRPDVFTQASFTLNKKLRQAYRMN